MKTAAEIKSLDELHVPERALFYVKREMEQDGLDVGQEILLARQTPYGKSAWRDDFRQALDEAGLIRHDFDEMSFRVGKLYLAIDPERYRGKVIGGLDDFESNEQYETYQNLSPSKIATVRNAVRDAMDPRRGETLLMRFGLTGGKPKTYQEIADEFGLTKERVRQFELDAGRHLRRASGAWLPELYMFKRETLDTQIAEITEQLGALQNAYQSILEKYTELQRGAKALTELRDAAFVREFRSPAKSAEIEEDDKDDTPMARRIESLELSVRCYNCLVRWGRMTTVGDILSYPPERLLRLRNFGRVSANELVAKMHEIGFSDFEIPGLDRLNEQAAKYDALVKELTSGEPVDGAKVDELSEIDKVANSSD